MWAYWPDPEGGAERQCRLLVESLTTAGHICTILAGFSLKAKSTQGVRRFGIWCPLENGMRRYLSTFSGRLNRQRGSFIPQVSFWLLAPFAWMARFSFILGLACYMLRHRQAPFDVIHVHDSGWLAGLGVWLGRAWGIPVLCKEATAPALKPVSFGTPFRRYWENLRKQADGWAAQTENIRGQLVGAGISAERVFLVPNGVCIPNALRLAGDQNGVLYVGNLTQGSGWKAFDVLFDAWIQVVQKRPVARLVFVGDGDSAPWQQVLMAAGVLDSVTFVGRAADPASYYANAGIFVLPSRVEGMSNALLEAQSWGCACVVSDIPGNTAVVIHDVNGFVVPVNDAAALAEAVIRLLDDIRLRQRLGATARNHMIQNYSVSSITDRLVDAYRMLISGTAA